MYMRRFFCSSGVRPFAGEDFGGCAGHEDVIVSFAPFQLKISAGEMGEQLSLSSTGEDTGDTDSARAGSTGERDAAAAFPGAHDDFIRSDDLDEVNIDSPRECGMPLKQRADLCQIDLFNTRCVSDRMGVPHRNKRRLQISPGVGDHIGMSVFAPTQFLDIDRNLGQREDWLAHVDGHPPHLAFGRFQCQRQHAAAGFDAHGVVPGQAMIERIFCDTADAVAAHLPFRSIGVEHAHPHIRLVRGEDENQAVAADAKMAIGNRDGGSHRILDRLIKAVDVNIVVADSMHFREAHKLISIATHRRARFTGARFCRVFAAVSPITDDVTLLDLPIAQTAAERDALANYMANRVELTTTQPAFAESLLPPREQVEWVYGRDGMLTALDEQGHWWSGCSLPRAAGAAMLKKMDLSAAVACFLAPPHAAHLRIALDKLSPGQAVIAVVPEDADARLMLSCDDFSKDFAAHRLWFAAGPTWAQDLELLLKHQTGLAVPGQFLRMHSTDEALIQKLISEATAVFSRITILRSNLIGQLAGSVAQARKFCVMTPMRFDLWNDEGRVLAAMAPAGSIHIDTSDPASSSPLKLATMACECGTLLTPNFSRADLPGALPMDVPWVTWITTDRVPGFASAGPGDRLLIASPAVLAAAIGAGWPKDRVQLAGWPRWPLDTAKGKRMLSVLADTSCVDTPADLEDFSSHRVLWETIRNEIASDPFCLDAEPGQYLSSRMSRFDVSIDSFPLDRFVTQLIVPAYQQGVARALIKAGLPVELHGSGWEKIEEFRAFACGVVRSHEETAKVVASASILVDVWPWRASHPIGAVNRGTVRRDGNNLGVFVQRARNVLAGAATVSAPTLPVLSSRLLANLLGAAPIVC
jgi:hypothetical protein